MPYLSYRLNYSEAHFSAVRSQGVGGQNVNKVASAVQLRFPIHTSSLPEEMKQRLLALSDRRISTHGEIVIKAQEHRTQEQNRHEAWMRLQELVRHAAFVPKVRKATAPSQASKKRRKEGKIHQSTLKKGRSRGMRAHLFAE